MRTKVTTTAAPWQQRFGGLRWQDMPGNDTVMKRINFFLFRRGELALDEEAQSKRYATAMAQRARAAGIIKAERRKAEDAEKAWTMNPALHKP